MPLITHPKAFRIIQLVFSLTYLSLISYCSTHIGYWRTNTSLAIALGISTSLLATLHLTYHLYHLLALHRTPSAVIYDTPATATTTTSTTLIPPSRSPLVTTAKVAAEIALLLLWAAVAAWMLQPKGKDFRVLFDEPPRVAWGFAVAVAWGEVVGFGLAAVSGVRDR